MQLLWVTLEYLRLQRTVPVVRTEGAPCARGKTVTLSSGVGILPCLLCSLVSSHSGPPKTTAQPPSVTSKPPSVISRYD